MVDPYFYSVMYVTFVVALISIWIIAHNDSVGRSQKFCFIAGIASVMIGTASEMVFLMTTNSPDYIFIQKASKVLEYSVGPLAPLFSACVFSSLKESKFFFFLVILHALLQLGCSFFGFVFSVDEMGIYHREFLYPAYNVFFVVCSLFAFWKVFVFSKTCQNRNASTLLFILLFFCTGTCFRLFNPELRVEWTTITITMTLFYLYYVVLLQQVDPLTHVLNKKCYEAMVDSLNFESAVIVFDVDDFKSINDTFGHTYGDKVLQVVSSCIVKTYGLMGVCYRIGGDEFCVIFKKGKLGDKSTDSFRAKIPVEYQIKGAPELPTKLYMLNYRFDRLLNHKSKRDPNLPRVSIGYAIFDNSQTFKEVFDSADRLMYLKKRQRKERQNK